MKKKQDFSENRSLEDRSWDLLAEMWAMQELKRSDCTEESESQRQEMEAFFSKYDTYNNCYAMKGDLRCHLIIA